MIRNETYEFNTNSIKSMVLSLGKTMDALFLTKHLAEDFVTMAKESIIDFTSEQFKKTLESFLISMNSMLGANFKLSVNFHENYLQLTREVTGPISPSL